MNSEIGKRYGYLTIIEDTGKKYHSTKIYKCRWDCGNIVEVNINRLHTGHVKSCGCRCFMVRDLTGRKFGRLTVVGFAYKKNKKTIGSASATMEMSVMFLLHGSPIGLLFRVTVRMMRIDLVFLALIEG